MADRRTATTITTDPAAKLTLGCHPPVISTSGAPQRHALLHRFMVEGRVRTYPRSHTEFPVSSGTYSM